MMKVTYCREEELPPEEEEEVELSDFEIATPLIFSCLRASERFGWLLMELRYYERRVSGKDVWDKLFDACMELL